MEAGQVLAELVGPKLKGADPLILALPRGGVPVAHEVSRALYLPLDIFLVRRFAYPQHPDKMAGSVASGGVHTLDFDCGLAPPDLERVLTREYAELARRERAYRQSRPAQSIRSRCTIVVDDGLTTGTTMRSAIRALRLQHPAHIIAAIPVGSAEVCADLEAIADCVVCARTPAAFSSVRRCYEDFSPVLDGEIRQSLAEAYVQTAPRAYRA